MALLGDHPFRPSTILGQKVQVFKEGFPECANAEKPLSKVDLLDTSARSPGSAVAVDLGEMSGRRKLWGGTSQTCSFASTVLSTGS